MRFTIPIYVEARRSAGHGPLFAVRPLFFPLPRRQHEKLEKAIQRLTDDLREQLRELGQSMRHDELARWTFSPALDTHRLDLQLLLRKHTARLRLFFVTFDALGRRLAFSRRCRMLVRVGPRRDARRSRHRGAHRLLPQAGEGIG